MGARKKRKCEECGSLANLSYDGLKLICSDCLKSLQDDIVLKHRSGKMVYGDAESILMERLRLSRYKAEELLHPPLGDRDLKSPNLDLKLSDHIRMMTEVARNEQGP